MGMLPGFPPPGMFPFWGPFPGAPPPGAAPANGPAADTPQGNGEAPQAAGETPLQTAGPVRVFSTVDDGRAAASGQGTPQGLLGDLLPSEGRL